MTMTRTRILVVDDDPWTQRVVIAALREQNHQIVTASDGAIAIAIATDDPPAEDKLRGFRLGADDYRRLDEATAGPERPGPAVDAAQ
jgi:DNA-binding response OmpR family regulator